ncbi:hypothetical protein [Tenacibaculum sp.]|uniref:hypothetical protein n=1 Tax=Tenacibaculum sp. TaxID=1906242 RepID=UPI003AA801FA
MKYLENFIVLFFHFVHALIYSPVLLGIGAFFLFKRITIFHVVYFITFLLLVFIIALAIDIHYFTNYLTF